MSHRLRQSKYFSLMDYQRDIGHDKYALSMSKLCLLEELTNLSQYSIDLFGSNYSREL
jgi:hypothetical protein